MSRMYKCLLTILFAVILCEVCESHSTVRIVKREERCPVFKDTTWKYRNSRCPSGKQYHCFQNGDSSIVDGCFTSKLCLRGAHPVVEGMNIVCDLCRTGFQPVDMLNTTEYTLSFCTPHSSDCDPSNGQTLCIEGTRERDRACTCNATLGFSPSSLSSICRCFTPNDMCSMCKFVGCLNGYTRNNKGYCEPAEVEEITVTSVPTVGSTTTESQAVPQTDDGFPGWAVAFIVIFFFFIMPWILLCMLLARLHERCHLALCEREVAAESTKPRVVQPDKTCFIILVILLPWFALVLSWKKGWLKILCMKESAKPQVVVEQETGGGETEQRLDRSSPQNIYIRRVCSLYLGTDVHVTMLKEPDINTITDQLEPNNQHTSHRSSSLVQEPTSQPGELAETVSEPVQPAVEEAEPLLPTAASSRLTDPPSGPTASSPVLPLLGPHSHPSSSGPSALLAESVSGPVQPAYEGAEPLLPAEPPLGLTVLPSVPTTPPLDPPLLGGPHPHPLSSDPLAVLVERVSGSVQHAYQEADPRLPGDPPSELMNLPFGLTVLPSAPPDLPPLGPHSHPSSSDPSALPLSSLLGLYPSSHSSSPAPEPSAPPPSLPYEDQDGVGSDSETTSVAESSDETSVKQIVPEANSTVDYTNENESGLSSLHTSWSNPYMHAHNQPITVKQASDDYGDVDLRNG